MGWLVYYLFTLPVFVLHTYMVAYLLIPMMLKRRFLLLSVALFLAFFYGFSLLDLILSHEFVFRWYPVGSMEGENYLNPAYVIRSGVGNLYIILVFLAARAIRDWHRADRAKNELQKEELVQRLESTLLRLQPEMLIYAIEQIEGLSERSDSKTTPAIAGTSNLLSEVMVYSEQQYSSFAREVELTRKLVGLVTLFKENPPLVEFFVSGDPGEIRIPPMILFSFMDMIIRELDNTLPIPEIHVEISSFSNMVTLQLLLSGQRKAASVMEQLRLFGLNLEKRNSGQLHISLETNQFGFSVIIGQGRGSSVSSRPDAVYSGVSDIH